MCLMCSNNYTPQIMGSNNNSNTSAQTSSSMVVIKGDQGEIQLPPGYKFKPDDLDLVTHYLKKMILNLPMTFRIKFLTDLYIYSPDELIFDECEYYVNNARYFFTYKYTTEHHQASEEGSWKLVPYSLQEITFGDQVIGSKQKLLFHWTDQAKENCFIYEYSVSIQLFDPAEINEDINHKVSNIVVCKVVRGDCDEDSDEEDDDGYFPIVSDDDTEENDDEEIDRFNEEIRETTLQT